MAINTTPVFQVRPSVTTPVSIWTPTSEVPECRIKIVNNHSSSTAVVKLYHDIDGSTFDEHSQILPETSLAPGEMIETIISADSSGQVGIETDTANIITATGYATERT